MPTINVLIKEKFATNMLEFLSGTNFNYLFTEPVNFGENSLVIFTISGNEEDIALLKKWVSSAFSTFSAVVCEYHLDNENRLTDIFSE